MNLLGTRNGKLFNNMFTRAWPLANICILENYFVTIYIHLNFVTLLARAKTVQFVSDV